MGSKKKKKPPRIVFIFRRKAKQVFGAGSGCAETVIRRIEWRAGRPEAAWCVAEIVGETRFLCKIYECAIAAPERIGEGASQTGA